MVKHVKTADIQFLSLRLFHLCLGNVAGFLHLRKYYITSLTAAFIESNRVEIRRILTHADQRGTLNQIQLARLFSKISICCISDADSIIEEIEIIEIHRYYFLLCIVSFKLNSNIPLNRLLHKSLTCILSHITI